MAERSARINQNVTDPVHDSAQPKLPASPSSGRHAFPLDRLSWDTLRLLLALAEAGSFRSAAQVVGVSLNTIRSKIERLERQFGTPLIRRSVEGVQLTQDGHELVAIAREMHLLGQSAKRVQRAGMARVQSSVRISATEGLGTFWLIPRVVEFRTSNPNVRVELNCDMTTPDVLFRDIDIAVQLKPPASGDLIVQRVGTMHLMPFASESYLREYGIPKSLADAPDHRLVWQEADQVATEALPLFVEGTVATSMIAVQTNTSSAHFWAVAKGAGIGFLPTYARAISRAVRPLDVGIHLRRDIYLVHHPDAARLPEVRAALDWLRDSFAKASFPWFADDFIHPDAFEDRFTDGIVVQLFEEFPTPVTP